MENYEREKRELERESTMAQKLCEEYLEIAARLDEELEPLGLDPASIERTGLVEHETLQVLVETAAALDIGGLLNLPQGAFFAAMVHHREELSEQRRLEREQLERSEWFEAKHLDEILPRLNEVEALLEKLESEREETERRCADLHRELGSYLPAKIAEYENTAAISTARLQQSGVSSKLTHRELGALARELAATETQLKPLEQKLALYHDLPADAALAQLRVEEAREELRILEEQWQRGIDSIESAFEF